MKVECQSSPNEGYDFTLLWLGRGLHANFLRKILEEDNAFIYHASCGTGHSIKRYEIV